MSKDLVSYYFVTFIKKTTITVVKAINYINVLNIGIIMECDYCNQIGPAKHRQHTGENLDVIEKTVSPSFTCRRCKGTFCADHRLPEMHDCIGLCKCG
ncbi:MAG: AN1-type zinc finger domain-containing protein [Methanosarcinaceae archaeon]|nr:AN1-type zinc finger domain-containing protein [Methanosarcinaceae archaeon]